MAAVRSGQRARRGGRSDRRGYGGVARMQPSAVPRREYPDTGGRGSITQGVH